MYTKGRLVTEEEKEAMVNGNQKESDAEVTESNVDPVQHEIGVSYNYLITHVHIRMLGTVCTIYTV